LTLAQLQLLPPHKREQVQKAITLVGSILIGKVITKELMVTAAKRVGMHITVKQATKYVPLAGQAISAFIGYIAIRYLGESHMKDCVNVAKAANLPLLNPSAAKNQLKNRVQRIGKFQI